MDDALKAIKTALEIIENDLNESLDLKQVAFASGYSLYHFHRLFRYYVDDSLKDYI